MDYLTPIEFINEGIKQNATLDIILYQSFHYPIQLITTGTLNFEDSMNWMDEAQKIIFNMMKES